MCYSTQEIHLATLWETVYCPYTNTPIHHSFPNPNSAFFSSALKTQTIFPTLVTNHQLLNYSPHSPPHRILDLVFTYQCRIAWSFSKVENAWNRRFVQLSYALRSLPTLVKYAFGHQHISRTCFSHNQLRSQNSSSGTVYPVSLK